MLPAAHRLRRSSDFSTVVRRGQRWGTRHVVVHHLPADGKCTDSARIGLVVSKAVGGSVVRHRVSRRLRAVLAERVDRLPAGSLTVVRALPPSAIASSRALAADLDRALARQR